MEFVVAIENALVFIVVILEYGVVCGLADLDAGCLEIGGFFPHGQIADGELMLVDCLLKDMSYRQ